MSASIQLDHPAAFAGEKTKAQYITVDPEFADQRIDNFLLQQLKGVPKSHIYKMLRTGEVRVNRGRIGADYRLRGGDSIRVPPLRRPAQAAAVPAGMARARLADRVLYEDTVLLAIDKPVGLAVHGGSGLDFGVIEGLRSLRAELPFLELVHRLDRDTSGCLLVAKKRSALRLLHEAFRSGEVEKTYRAIVAGRVRRDRLTADAPLRRFVLQGGERMVRVDADGKPSRTEFRVVQRFRDATLLEARPLTGRTHQIRVHAQYLGHPLLGDGRYGSREIDRSLQPYGLNRLCLHAAALRLRHPLHGGPLELEAPLDLAMQTLLERLPT